jgi:ribosomal protein L11 methyltransferase
LDSAPTPAFDIHWRAGADLTSVAELLYAALDDLDPIAIHDEDERWRVFFKTVAARDHAARVIGESFRADVSRVQSVDVADEDWARRSQAGLRAVHVGSLTISPPWDVPPSAAANAVVVIDPSMGFGTGHHETTRLCLALMQQIDLNGRDVVDVGTGSGVLAIAAMRLGAASAVALDEDADALANAAENVARNDVAVSLIHTDLASFAGASGDIVTANLTGAVLVRHAAALRRLVAPAGALIVSGFSPGAADEVASAFGGAIASRMDDGAWSALRLTFPREER